MDVLEANNVDESFLPSIVIIMLIVLAEMVKSSGRLEMNTWQAEYENWKISMTVISGACYEFLGILAAIIVSVVLLLVQAVMALAIAGSVRKVPLIERIRFSE